MASENDAGFIDGSGVVVFGVPDEGLHGGDGFGGVAVSGEGWEGFKEVEDAPLGDAAVGVVSVV